MSEFGDTEKRWGFAIEEWLHKRPDRLEAEIAAMDIPGFARDFLTDLTRETVKRPQGRPREYDGNTQRRLANQVFAEWDRLKELSAPAPKDTAIEAVAKRNKMKCDALRNLMAEMKKCGWTLDFWRTNIKPTYKLGPKRR